MNPRSTYTHTHTHVCVIFVQYNQQMAQRSGTVLTENIFNFWASVSHLKSSGITFLLTPQKKPAFRP